jgi:tetratricopeptide (TPR) repeat protein
MFLRSFAVFLLFVANTTLASAKSDPWVEVRTPRFIVVTDSSERQARQVAEQFERMRTAFHRRFPGAQVDAESPIIVLAIRDSKNFRALEPEVYLAKGAVELGGLFARSNEKNYVLLRLNAEGEHPYAAVYHEYVHFIFSHGGQWLPTWLNEGLAEFYQTMEIRDKEVEIGEPDINNIRFLRRNRLLPLETLFAVDQNSPYYHEDNKANIFYAEAWALTHYLEIRALHDKVDPILRYVDLVNNKVDPVTAATTAFGNLRALEKSLNVYLEQPSLTFLTNRGAIEVDKSAFKTRTLTPIESDAVEADFLAYVQRVKDSRELLDRILKQAPDNASAHETMGLLATREGKWQDAADAYELAAKFDPQNYLIHYSYAIAAIRAGGFANRGAQIEASLRAATTLNPDFAPALDQLAAFYVQQGRHLDEAYKLELRAVQLDPRNVFYRMNGASLLVRMQRPDDALAVLQTAAQMATDPAQLASIQNRKEGIERFRAQMEQRILQHGTGAGQIRTTERLDVVEEQSEADPQPVADAEPVHGPRRTAIGTLSDVQCSSPSTMQLKLAGGAKPLSLRTRNYFKVAYSAVNFTPSANLNPCTDLEKKTAKVEYFESPTSSAEGQIVSIELRK